MAHRLGSLAVAVVIAVGAFVLGGCSDDGNEWVGDGSAEIGADESAHGSSGGEPNPIHGVVTLVTFGVGQPPLLQVHDPATGAVQRTIELPDPPFGATSYPLGGGMASQFNGDWTLHAWIQDSALHVARRVAVATEADAHERFERFATWEPERSFSDGRATYTSPVFNPVDGRLWFKQEPAGTGSGETIVWSVDPVEEGDEPRREETDDGTLAFDSRGDRALAEQVELAGAGRGDDSDYDMLSATVEIHRTEAEVVDATVELSSRQGNGTYRCPWVRDPTTLLCVAFGDPPHGSVVALSVDEPGVAHLEEIVGPPSTDEEVRAAAISPDHSQALLGIGTQGVLAHGVSNWFVANLEGGSPEPEPVYEALPSRPGAYDAPNLIAWL